MTLVFPGSLLRPRSVKPGLVGKLVDGGTALVGPGQSAELSGGGWWTLDYDLGNRAGPERLKLIRAVLMKLANGATEMVMPFVDEPQAPWPGTARGPTLTTFSDSSVFSDGTLFSQPTIDFRLTADLAENATTATVTRLVGGELIGGELFTLDHGGAIGARVYCVSGLEQTGADTFDLEWGPPARGAALADDLMDFEQLRCVMKQVPGTAEAWPTVTTGWKASASLRFVESFDYLLESDA